MAHDLGGLIAPRCQLHVRVGGESEWRRAVVPRNSHGELRRALVDPALLARTGEVHHVLKLVGDCRIERLLAGTQRVQVHVDHVVLVRARIDGPRVGVRAREVGGHAGHVSEQEHDVAVAVDARLGLRTEVALDQRVRAGLEHRGRTLEIRREHAVGQVRFDEPIRMLGDQAQRRGRLKQLGRALVEDPEGIREAGHEPHCRDRRDQRRRRGQAPQAHRQIQRLATGQRCGEQAVDHGLGRRALISMAGGRLADQQGDREERDDGRRTDSHGVY